jgi:hypothetical protein
MLPTGAFSDDARGTTSAGFLKVPPSARMDALADCGLALRDPDGFFLNPAGTVPESGPARAAASVSYEALLEGASRTGLVFALPAGGGVASAGLLYHDASSGLQNIDAAGTGTGTDIAAYDAAFGAGWARRFGRTALGLNLKYLRSRLAGEAGSSFAGDAGAVFAGHQGSATEFALAVRNFGPPLKLGSEKAPLPFELGGGLKWRASHDFDVFMEGRMPCDHSPYLAFAGEWYLPSGAASGFSVRGGLNFRNYSDHGIMGAFTGGFGLKTGSFSLDYAFTPYGDLGAAHRMTAGWAWGRPAAPPARKPLPRGPLAVGAFSAGDGVTAEQAGVVRGLLESELARGGSFRPADRSKLEFILAEKKLAYAGLSEQRTAVELGRAAGVRLVVFGGVSRAGNGYLISVKAADTASGELLRSETAAAADDYLFSEAVRGLAARLAGN